MIHTPINSLLVMRYLRGIYNLADSREDYLFTRKRSSPSGEEGYNLTGGSNTGIDIGLGSLRPPFSWV